MNLAKLLIPVIAGLLASCGPHYRAYLNPDQSISIHETGGNYLGSTELRIEGAQAGLITPASKLKAVETVHFKGTFTSELELAGFIDRTKTDSIDLRLATPSRVAPFTPPRDQDSPWRQSRYNGTHPLTIRNTDH